MHHHRPPRSLAARALRLAERAIPAVLAVVLAAISATGCARVGTPQESGGPSYDLPPFQRVEPEEPLESVDEGWSEEGIASWYGESYHGRPTASGEPFDMHASTAAHRRLPFGTLVRVRNLENGKQATLRINDRGPFVRGRVVDVSRRGAEELGLVAPGTAEVRLTVVETP